MAYDVEKEAAKVINRTLMVEAALDNPALVEEVRKEMAFSAVGLSETPKPRNNSNRKTRRVQANGRNIFRAKGV